MEQVTLHFTPNLPERGQTPSTAAPRIPSFCSLPSLPAPREEGIAGDIQVSLHVQTSETYRSLWLVLD